MNINASVVSASTATSWLCLVCLGYESIQSMNFSTLAEGDENYFIATFALGEAIKYTGKGSWVKLLPAQGGQEFMRVSSSQGLKG